MAQSLICCFCLCFALLQAQGPYHPMLVKGRTWEVFYRPPELGICTYHMANRYFLGSDTTLNGQSYQTLWFHPIQSSPAFPFCGGFYCDTTQRYFKAFVREDTLLRRVYHWYPWEPAEQLLFDFSLEAGDSLRYDQIAYPIVATRQIALMNGVQRKALSITDMPFPQAIPNEFVAGIGYLLGAFSPVFYPFEGWAETTCVRDGTQRLYEWKGSGCIDATISTDAPILYTLSVFPNPIDDHFTIVLPPSAQGKVHPFRLYDLTGRLLLDKICAPVGDNFSLEISSLPPGTYQWQWGNYWGRMVKTP